MPTYQITSPDGKVFQVTAPEGTTESEILAKVAQQSEPESDLLAAGAAGASRGVLGTLDLLPRGLAGLYNTLTGSSITGSPFAETGAAFGVGTRQPQTPAEEKASFAGQLLGASALPAAGTITRAAAPVRALLTESAAAGGAIGGGLLGGEVGGPIGQTVGTIAGGFAPMAAPWAARTIVSPVGQRNMADVLDAASRQDVPVSAGQAAGGSALEKASATLPIGGRVAEKFRERQASAMGERVEQLARRLTKSEASAESAGRAITKGLDQWTAKFKESGGKLFGLLDELIPPTTETTLPNLRRQLDDLIKDEDFSKILDSPLVRQLRETLSAKGVVSYETARGIRSRIGEKLSSPELVADISRGQAKSLYGALSKDLDEIAKAAGPNAERVSKMANRHWKAGMKRIDDFLDPIQKRGIPEDVFRAAISGTKEGGSRIRALKRSLNPAQWNVVVATTLRRLGRAKRSERTTGEVVEEATDFNPETFLTNMEGIDVKARKVLFSGTQYEGLESNINDLRKVAQAIREQRQVLYNPSGTAGALYNAIGLGAPLAALPFSPTAAAASAGAFAANAGLQRALQSPSVVNYLANPTQFSPSLLPQLTRGSMLSPDIGPLLSQ